jgi:hypothetical protein
MSLINVKPLLKPENSIITALATAALIIGIYNASVGPIADVHATGANDSNLAASVKKAGVKSVILVAAITLLSRDSNIIVLGGAAIIGEELTYRHALMASPDTGQVQVTPASYVPAGSSEPVGSTALGTYASGVVEAVAG